MRLSAFLLTLALGGCDKSPEKPVAAVPTASVTAQRPAQLQARLAAALEAKGKSYVPRTKHKDADGTPKYTNRLILETSPYLLQHAHNPVDWFGWGDEAFETAKRRGVPIFLSVGYSTCHWCHVMEEESFEDEEIAKYINQNYVAIKVDREVRPDVDAIYMQATQMLTGSGGWPMSVWLTPAREPFFAGTYFPPRAGVRGARRGFIDVLREQRERFAKSPDTVVTEARRLAAQIARGSEARPSGDVPTLELIARATGIAKQRFDPTFGGARGAPKFPSSFPVRLLFRVSQTEEGTDSLTMAVKTLDGMRRGGIYDHVAGGFHRYSVDERWLVPHFEKMLYDNALLIQAYLDGFQRTGQVRFADVVRETADYIVREMQSPAGAFYSATDADSLTPSGHREEGYFFTWTPAELDAAIGKEKAKVFREIYGVRPSGNFEGRTVLSIVREPTEVAKALDRPLPGLLHELREVKAVLRRVRAKRPPPLRDDKVQASWNGLMIGALARAGRVLAEPRYVKAAAKAAAFVRGKLTTKGKLRHSHAGNQTGSERFLEDNAFCAVGALELFYATADAQWLKWAEHLMDQLHADFGDKAHGGYFQTPHDSEKLIARSKPDTDGAIPSGSSLALLAELSLYELTDADRFRARAETTTRSLSDRMLRHPGAFDEGLLAVDFQLQPVKQILVVYPKGESKNAQPLIDVLRRQFVPRAVSFATDAESSSAVAKSVPWAAEKVPRADRATAYVCRRGACKLPTSDPRVLEKQLR